MNLLERGLLRGIQCRAARGSARRTCATVSGLSETYPLRASDRGRRAGAVSPRPPVPSGCASPDAVPETRAVPRSGLLSLGCAPLPVRGQFHAQTLRRRAQRIALRLHLLGDDETLALQASGSPYRPAASLWRDRPPRAGAFRACAESAIPGRPVTNRAGAGARHRARNRSGSRFSRGRISEASGQHAAQHIAQRRAVIARNPPPQRHQLRTEHRLAIDQAQCIARGHPGGSSWQRRITPGQLAWSERHHEAAAHAHAMPQRVRQRISERLIERHRQTDVAIKVGSLGHGRLS